MSLAKGKSIAWFPRHPCEVITPLDVARRCLRLCRRETFGPPMKPRIHLRAGFEQELPSLATDYHARFRCTSWALHEHCVELDCTTLRLPMTSPRQCYQEICERHPVRRITAHPAKTKSCHAFRAFSLHRAKEHPWIQLSNNSVVLALRLQMCLSALPSVECDKGAAIDYFGHGWTCLRLVCPD